MEDKVNPPVDKVTKRQVQRTERQELALRVQFARAVKLLEEATESNRISLLPVLLQEIETIRSLLRHMVYGLAKVPAIEETKVKTKAKLPLKQKLRLSERVCKGQGFVHNAQGQTRKSGGAK